MSPEDLQRDITKDKSIITSLYLLDMRFIHRHCIKESYSTSNSFKIGYNLG